MSSALPTNKIRQNSPTHFMTVAPLQGQVFAYNPTAGQTTFSTASWAWVGTSGQLNATASPYVSSITAAGGLLRDIGKSVVSSNRYFRKVQLVVPNGARTNNQSTFGVAGTGVGTLPNSDYLTGYIELGLEGGGTPAPVVQFGAA